MSQNRNIIIFTIAGILAVWMGFFQFDAASRGLLYVKSIYYFLSVSLFLWIVTTAKAVENVSLFFKKHWQVLAVSLVIMGLGFLSCRPDYRILADETNLLSDSQSFYENKECFITASVLNYANGQRDILSSFVDMRPAFFPYLVSLCHSLFGYDIDNPFVVNYFAGALTLFLCYFLIQLRFGRFWGICGMGCLSAYPLFILYSASAGFDVFNVLCSLVFFVCLYYFIEKPVALRAEVLLLWLPLLAQSRYESALAVLVTLPVIAFKLPKSEYSNLTFRTWIMPLLFLPVAWLRVVSTSAGSVDAAGIDTAFGIDFLGNNFVKLLEFFFSNKEAFEIIPLFSVLAVLFLLTLFKKERRTELLKNKYMFYAVIVFYIFHAIPKLAFCLGDVTEVLASRHALIYLPLIVYMTVGFIEYCNTRFGLKRLFCSIAVIWILLIYWPDAGHNCGVKDIPIYREFSMLRKVLNDYFQNKNEFVIISNRPNFYSPLGYSSVSFKACENKKDKIIGYYLQRNCRYFIVLQNILDSSSKPFEGYELPAYFKSEKLLELKIREGFTYRISRCVPDLELVEATKQ